MTDIENRFVDVAHPVPQQIDSHHGKGILATVHHVLWIVILHTKVLAESQRLRL